MRDFLPEETELLERLFAIAERYPREAVAFVANYHMVGAAFALKLRRSDMQQLLYDMRQQEQTPIVWPGGESMSAAQLEALGNECIRELWRAKLHAGGVVNVCATILLRLHETGLPLSVIENTLNIEWRLTEAENKD